MDAIADNADASAEGVSFEYQYSPYDVDFELDPVSAILQYALSPMPEQRMAYINGIAPEAEIAESLVVAQQLWEVLQKVLKQFRDIPTRGAALDQMLPVGLALKRCGAAESDVQELLGAAVQIADSAGKEVLRHLAVTVYARLCTLLPEDQQAAAISTAAGRLLVSDAMPSSSSSTLVAELLAGAAQAGVHLDSACVAYLKQLGNSPKFQVREDLVGCLMAVVPVLDQTMVVEDILPIFLNLCREPMWAVRRQCTLLLPLLCARLEEEDQAEVVNVFEALAHDSSVWVRDSLAGQLGHFICALKPALVTHEMLTSLVDLAGTRRQLLGEGSNLSLACAEALSNVTKHLGASQWPTLKPMLSRLAGSLDEQVVSRLLGCCAELFNTLGSELWAKDVQPQVEQLLLHRLPLVKAALVEHLGLLLTAAPADTHHVYVQAMHKVMMSGENGEQTGAGGNWRLRRAVAVQLGNLATIVALPHLTDFILPAAVELLGDCVAAVRQAAAQQLGTCLAVLVNRGQVNWDQVMAPTPLASLQSSKSGSLGAVKSSESPADIAATKPLQSISDMAEPEDPGMRPSASDSPAVVDEPALQTVEASTAEMRENQVSADDGDGPKTADSQPMVGVSQPMAYTPQPVAEDSPPVPEAAGQPMTGGSEPLADPSRPTAEDHATQCTVKAGQPAAAQVDVQADTQPVGSMSLNDVPALEQGDTVGAANQALPVSAESISDQLVLDAANEPGSDEPSTAPAPPADTSVAEEPMLSPNDPSTAPVLPADTCPTNEHAPSSDDPSATVSLPAEPSIINTAIHDARIVADPTPAIPAEASEIPSTLPLHQVTAQPPIIMPAQGHEGTQEEGAQVSEVSQELESLSLTEPAHASTSASHQSSALETSFLTSPFSNAEAARAASDELMEDTSTTTPRMKEDDASFDIEMGLPMSRKPLGSSPKTQSFDHAMSGMSPHQTSILSSSLSNPETSISCALHACVQHLLSLSSSQHYHQRQLFIEVLSGSVSHSALLSPLLPVMLSHAAQLGADSVVNVRHCLASALSKPELQELAERENVVELKEAADALRRDRNAEVANLASAINSTAFWQ